MKVILLQDVSKLGRKGDLIEVSDGYARNFLFPKALAEEGTEAKVKNWALAQEQKKLRDDKLQKQAVEQQKQIGGKSVAVSVKAGEGGRLFGSVTSAQVAEAIAQQLGVAIDKKEVKLPDQLKQLGSHPFKVRLYPGVEAELTLLLEGQ